MSDSKDTSFWWKVAAWAIWLPALNVGGYAFSEDAHEAKHAAEMMGYSNVSLGSGQMFAHFRGCGASEFAGYEMTSTAPNGEPSTGLVVCCGVFGGCTVRSDDP